MAISKLILNGVTQMDVTSTTAVANDVAQGKNFILANGEESTGTGAIGAISITETSDVGGGTVLDIDGVDISDTTATAADVASGKYFYTAEGTKTQGTATSGGGTKTYIIKDGKIQNGYTFSAVQCILTEETTDGIDYVLVKGTSTNQYQATYTPLVTVPTGVTHIVLELAEINGSYGWTWCISGGAYNALSASNAVNTSAVLDSWTSVSIKISVTGAGSHLGIANIKNLYFES